MINIKQKGSFVNTEKFFTGTKTANFVSILEKYAHEGVSALESVTPIDSGKTASAWDYQISYTSKGAKISWTNSNTVDDVPVVILIQYGHATKSGGYVQGRDFINPAMKPIFDRIASELWKEVTKL
jgi:hypothetical protein